MKIRNSFISNSSTTSFICMFCNECSELENQNVIMCEKGHIFDPHCLFGVWEMYVLENRENYFKDVEDNGCIEECLKEEHCPVCTFKKLDKKRFYKFMWMSIRDTEVNSFYDCMNSEEEILDYLKERFKTIDEFNKYCDNIKI